MADDTPVKQAIDALISRFAPLTGDYAEFLTAIDALIAAVRAEQNRPTTVAQFRDMMRREYGIDVDESS